MNGTERDLANALRERRAIIADEVSRQNPERHGARLESVSEKITHLQQQLPPPIDPRLAHFLERCSYDKALEFLERQASARPGSSTAALDDREIIPPSA